MIESGELEKFMRLAVKTAKKALKSAEIPVGALIVKDGKVISSAYNRRAADSDPTAHAEILALKRAGKKLGLWNLSGCDIVVTLEPCAMCAGAIVNARIDNLYFGAYDKRFGYCGTLYNLPEDERLNHRVAITGGIMEDECAQLLKDFFLEKRKKKEPSV